MSVVCLLTLFCLIANVYMAAEDKTSADDALYRALSTVKANCSIQKTVPGNYFTNSSKYYFDVMCRVGSQDNPWNWTQFQLITNQLAKNYSYKFSIRLNVACYQTGFVIMKRPHQIELVWSLTIRECPIYSYRSLNPILLIPLKNDLKTLVLDKCVLHIRRNNGPSPKFVSN